MHSEPAAYCTLVGTVNIGTPLEGSRNRYFVIIKQPYLLILAVFFLLPTAGCTTTPLDQSIDETEVEVASQAIQAPAPRPKPSDYPVEPFPQDSMYQLLVAEVAGYRGHYEMALDKYIEMAEETRDAGVAARATRLASYLKREDLALRSARLWAEVEPDNIEAHRHSAELLMRSGDLENAILHMESVKNLGGLANFDVFAYRAANLDDTGREALLRAISRMLENYPDDDQLKFSKAVLLEQKGEMEEALALANALLENEENINVVILKVNALRNLNRNDDAIRFLDDTISDLTEADTESRRDTLKRLRLIYARFLFENKKLDDARGQYELVLKTAPNDGDVLFALALIAMEQDKDADAKGYFNQMVRWNRRVGEARYYLGSIAEKNGETDEAIREYRQVGRGYEFLPAKSRIANLMVEQGRVAEMQEYLGNLRADNPDSSDQLVMIEAQAFVDRGMQDEAYELLDQVIDANSSNVDLLYFRAMTGQKFDRLDILERDLKQIIQLEPENADALNALGYTLTDQTERHEEALELIERALAIKPNEAAFIDSLGWVHYRLQNFELAIQHLRRALELFTNDEVAAHLGEALWAIGDTVEAKKVWDEALKIAPDSEILQRVIEKFTAN
jgi:tetratricopeptide (TPR) repeat protein